LASNSSSFSGRLLLLGLDWHDLAVDLTVGDFLSDLDLGGSETAGLCESQTVSEESALDWMGRAALHQPIQADRGAKIVRGRNLGSDSGEERENLRRIQIKMFPKTLPNHFSLSKFRNANVQEGIRRRRLTLVPILEESEDDSIKNLEGD
jgi:hypothetical protein